MRVSVTWMLISLFAAIASGCAPSGTSGPPASGTAADEAVIRAGTETWNSAYNASDIDRILALYADDAVVMAPGLAALAGREAIRGYLTKDIPAAKAAGLTVKDGTSTVGMSGDLAWHAGTSSVVDAAGKTVETGKYLEVWRRSSGKWLIIQDIWNDDAPTAPTPAQ